MRDKKKTDQTIFRTPAPNCDACKESRLHRRPDDWKHHPEAGHGFVKERSKSDGQ